MFVRCATQLCYTFVVACQQTNASTAFCISCCDNACNKRSLCPLPSWMDSAATSHTLKPLVLNTAHFCNSPLRAGCLQERSTIKPSSSALVKATTATVCL